jgi:hypothetical protein
VDSPCYRPFSKLNLLWAIEHKTAEEGARGLEANVFAHYGCPKILQSENGLEFKNSTMVKLIPSWDGDTKLIYGRPRQPQSQGLVEQSNRTMERMIALMII